MAGRHSVADYDGNYFVVRSQWVMNHYLHQLVLLGRCQSWHGGGLQHQEQRLLIVIPPALCLELGYVQNCHIQGTQLTQQFIPLLLALFPLVDLGFKR